jgi:hypothetical protein
MFGVQLLRRGQELRYGARVAGGLGGAGLAVWAGWFGIFVVAAIEIGFLLVTRTEQSPASGTSLLTTRNRVGIHVAHGPSGSPSCYSSPRRWRC